MALTPDQIAGLNAAAARKAAGTANAGDVNNLDFAIKNKGYVLPAAPAAKPPVIVDPNAGAGAKKPTIEDVANGITIPDFTGLNETETAIGNRFKEQATGVVDEAAIRAATRSRMQSEIDAINQIYDQKLSDAKRQGEGRMGSARSGQARGGLLGSDFAESENTKVQDFNQGIEDTVQSERASRINSILTQVNTDATTEITAKRAALESGATNYLSFVNGERERKKSAATNIAKMLIAQKLTPDSLDAASLQKLADVYGLDKASFQSIYDGVKADTAKAALETQKTQSEIDKNNYHEPTKLAPGEVLIGADGKQIASAPDKPIEVAPGGSLVDGDGNVLFTAPQKPLTPNEKTVTTPNGDVLVWNEASQAYSLVYRGGKPSEKKIVSINGKDYEYDPSTDTYSTPKTPGGVDTSQIDSTVSLIDELLADPNLPAITGLKGITNFIPGSASQLTKNKLNQLISSLSLESRSKLKGSGAISDFEAKTLESAASSLGRNLSNDDLIKVLTDLKTSFGTAKTRAMQQGGQEPTGPNLDDVYLKNPDKRPQIDEMKRDGLAPEDILRALGLTNVGTDTNPGTNGKGARTDRHNNPTAFTTDIAKQAGLVEGRDYVAGDAFPNNPNYKTAKLLGDPISQTIKVIDNIGLYTQSGAPRWTYVNSIPGARNWASLDRGQKVAFIKQMYQHEGGNGLLALFGNNNIG